MGVEVRVATFNIRHGKGMSGRLDLHAVAGVIAGLDAGVVAVQEIDRGLERSGNVDQAEALGRVLGMKTFFAPALAIDGGSYGIGLLTHGGVDAVVQALPRVGDEEPRVAIVARWRDIDLIATHLSRSAPARSAQTGALAEMAGAVEGPLVVLGDLNQKKAHLGPLIREGLTPVGTRGRTAWFRRGLGIDHILVSTHLRPLRAWSVPTSVSDHDPLVADLEFAGA